MKLSPTFWLALTAIVLALGAVAVRVARGKVDDFTDIIAPVAISLLMLGILGREWAKAKGNP